MNCQEFEYWLNPYFDGELALAESLATERHLSECDPCRRKYKQLEWLRGEIHAADAGYVPPPALVRKARKLGSRAVDTRRISWWGAGLLAAALAALLLWPQMRRSSSTPELRQALDSHLRSLLSSNIVDVSSSDRHTVKPWFQGRLGFSPSVIDLSAEGFVLVGGRLEVIRQQRAAALVYKRREHVINLFIAEGGEPDSARSAQSQGYNLISWTDRGLSYCAVSDLNAQELSAFAHLIRTKQ